MGGGQLEVAPSTGKWHFQGFCVVKDKTTIKGMKKKYSTPHFDHDDDVHWEIMRGTLEQSEEYCSKEESRAPGSLPVTWGIRPLTGQGARSDLAEAVTTFKNKGIQGLVDDHPTVFVKYASGFQKMIPYIHKADPSPSPTTWRDWQNLLLEELKGDPHPRKIIWYYDQSGAAGKSTIVRHLITRAEAISLKGRIADMAYAYNGERAVFFDISRTMADNMDHLYQFAEDLKNGSVFSTKYESRTKTFKAPHVVFMSNSLPDYSKWSSDRYDVRTLNPLEF